MLSPMVNGFAKLSQTGHEFLGGQRGQFGSFWRWGPAQTPFTHVLNCLKQRGVQSGEINGFGRVLASDRAIISNRRLVCSHRGVVGHFRVAMPDLDNCKFDVLQNVEEVFARIHIGSTFGKIVLLGENRLQAKCLLEENFIPDRS